jgi:hypothetical protein
MRIPEENCNIVLLTAVTLFSIVVALAANWWEGPQTASAKPRVDIAEQRPVRMIGAPFVPNVDPRQR